LQQSLVVAQPAPAAEQTGWHWWLVLQAKPVQQSAFAVQVAFEVPHELVRTQVVPLQARPVQQLELLVQLWPSFEHVGACRQEPPVQTRPVQQVALSVQG
jgi:hypothetical protein